MFQIVSAVQYCHQKHVIHRDLKVLFLIIINKAKKIKLFLRDFINIDASVELCLRLNADLSIWNILFSLTFSFLDMYMTLSDKLLSLIPGYNN